MHECEKNIEKLESIVKERTNEIKRLSIELDNARISNEKLSSDKARLLGEIERYKSHIIVLTDQNQKVSTNFHKIYFV
jgi:chromosome segregation ATPase